jgi:hypothetical protein
MGKGSAFGMAKVAPATGWDCDILTGGCGAKKGRLCFRLENGVPTLELKKRCCKGRRSKADAARTKEVLGR